MYYVYYLTSTADESPFYVGKGQKNRCFAHIRIAKGRGKNKLKNPKLYNKIEKLLREGQEIIPLIVYRSVDEADCLAEEVRLIELIGLENLCNLTLGGEGLSGYKLSDATKRKMSDAKVGHVVSDETRSKISKALKGRKGKGGTAKGSKLSEETKNKMSEAHKGKQRKPRSEETKRKISESMRNKKRG